MHHAPLTPAYPDSWQVSRHRPRFQITVQIFVGVGFRGLGGQEEHLDLFCAHFQSVPNLVAVMYPQVVQNQGYLAPGISKQACHELNQHCGRQHLPIEHEANFPLIGDCGDHVRRKSTIGHPLNRYLPCRRIAPTVLAITVDSRFITQWLLRRKTTALEILTDLCTSFATFYRRLYPVARGLVAQPEFPAKHAYALPFLDALYRQFLELGRVSLLRCRHFKSFKSDSNLEHPRQTKFWRKLKIILAPFSCKKHSHLCSIDHAQDLALA